MRRRTARGNKLGLALAGLVLLLAGVALFLGHQGAFGGAGRRDVLYPHQARSFVGDNTSWLWPVAAAVAVVIGLVFLRWLLVQGRTDRLRSLIVDSDDHSATDPSAGRTRMPAHAVTDVLEDDITALRGVRRVSAGLSGHSDAPQLWLAVSTDSDADVGLIRRAITTEVVHAARECLDLPDLTTYLQLSVSNRTSGRKIR